MASLKLRKWLKKSVIRAFQFAMAVGFVSIAIATAYKFIVEDVSLTFVKPFGRYYVFELENESPSDQVIESFEVVFPAGQPLVARTTRDIYTNESDSGKVTLPGGNSGWIPTVEFTELNGQIVGANKKKKFRLPPASSIDYLRLEAAIFDVSYRTHPTSKLLKNIDAGLKWLGLKNTETKIRYIMVDNNWFPTASTSLNEALRLACRDDRSLGVGYQCPSE
ncbi:MULTISPECIES: hypothetical protein [Pseudomonas syringae group]|uniref:Uncharacterized protein n=2 Tax=Pseudomonas syringae group TaxID=136849 RepID=A0A2K4X2J2_PSESX|nr:MULTISPECIES: hypothetical protein [Pseudomonas syringae group]AVB12499.1 hypothetical protein BKM19_001840 [Pseudomonas amygdali pv. morsprunorum]KWS49957.1 hypothetical protein AL056_01670 [Pseudomonas amygdali pv. morsprunorum]KWS65142.1 hypothetical protein AL054_01355 [Pseudomonas amygdali pv. morsprunorum]MBI6814640.1 hypothetical protein [Pseudomonas amygdali]MDT3226912.1 hypothetical protein [Pseudomonas amygdali pv. morsprunorum]